jgi:spore maturation protein CgeB
MSSSSTLSITSSSSLNKERVIMTVLLSHEYGRFDLGESCDKRWFHDTFVSLGYTVEAFWYDAWVSDQTNLREAVLGKIRNVEPDLIVFVPFRDQFSPVLLDEIRELAPTLAFFGDDHWRFDSFSSQYAPHFTYVVTTNPWIVPRYRRLGVEPIVSDWASELPREEAPPIGCDAEFLYDVTFVGGKNEVRQWFIRSLAKRGIKVECFGFGWKNGRVSVPEMHDIFNRSRINLNLSNSVNSDVGFVLGGVRNFARWLISKKRSEQVKARNFEIPMAGGFQLTNYVLGLERHFHIGRELITFGNLEECIWLIRYFLDCPEERMHIAKKSYFKARAEHTFHSRFEAIFSKVWRD